MNIKFNQYIWDLYKESKDGKACLEWFRNLDSYLTGNNEVLKEQPTFLERFNLEEFYEENYSLSKLIKVSFMEKSIPSLEEANVEFEKFVQEGIFGFDRYGNYRSFRESNEKYERQDYLGFLDDIDLLSVGLHRAYPDFFFPYLFKWSFGYLEKISNEFDIFIPEISQKSSSLERLFYYLKLNSILYEFRSLYQLDPYELNAFLYSFSINFIREDRWDSLDEPKNIWIAVTKGDDNKNLIIEQTYETLLWSSNRSCKRGDIFLMYLTYPDSYFHSVYRCISDGYKNPFYAFDSHVEIGEAIVITPVKFTDLQNNAHLKETAFVKRKMWGANSNSIQDKDYNEILRILEDKGFDTTVLPRIKKYEWMGVELKNEKDVEVHLIESLLERIGYLQNDWVRQLPVRMGTGIRYYPDYVFGYRNERGNESAKLVVEAKYRIKSDKQLYDAFNQARSYASRLRCKCFCVASQEGIWVFRDSELNFSLKKSSPFTWSELQNPQTLASLEDLIGKKALKKF